MSNHEAGRFFTIRSLEPIAGGTRITWRNEGNLPYPIGRYFGLGVEGMLGPQCEKGLANLKRVCESIPETQLASPEANSSDMERVSGKEN